MRRLAAWSLLLLLLTPAPLRARVFVVGLDGASWDQADPLMAAGRMPNLRKLVERGTRAVLLSREPDYSPRIWTDIATGKTVEKHGIRNFFVGERRYTSRDRRAAALWTLVGGSRTVCSAGYMMTWPAEAVNGAMVSDQYFNDKIPDRVVFPPDLALKTSRSREDLRPAARALARGMTDFTPARDWQDLPRGSTAYLENLLYFRRLRYGLTHDEGFTRIAEELLSGHPCDLFLIHIWGIDFAGHGFWKYQDGEPGADPRHPFARVIPDYYAYADSLLGRLLRFAGPHDTVIVLSDHGMRRRDPAHGRSQPYLSGEHQPEGLFAAAGPDVKAGRRAKPVEIYDVAPTILRLLGLPAARDLDGQALADILDPAPPAPPDIATYDRPEPPAAAEPGTPLSPDELQLLRASGYIQ